MGNDQTTLRQKDLNRLQMSKYLEISAQHNKKVYQKNIKTLKQFKVILKSIHIRSTYLKYQWAIQLCQELLKNPQKLYQQYCDAFRLCIQNRSHTNEYFFPKLLTQKFFSSLQIKVNQLLQVNFDNKQLQELFQEVKCYFMVLNWFQKFPFNNLLQHNKIIWNVNESSKQNVNTQKSSQFRTFKKETPSQNDTQRQKIYRLLLKLTEKYFDGRYFEKQLTINQSQQTQSPRYNPIKRFNSTEGNLIKFIARQLNFRQRQIYIASLIDLLFENYQNDTKNYKTSLAEEKKIKALIQILGLKNVYCVLRILTEVGQIQQIQKISILQNYILQNFLKTSSQKVDSTECLIIQKSPQKKQKISKKVRTESIR